MFLFLYFCSSCIYFIRKTSFYYFTYLLNYHPCGISSHAYCYKFNAVWDTHIHYFNTTSCGMAVLLYREISIYTPARLGYTVSVMCPQVRLFISQGGSAQYIFAFCRSQTAQLRLPARRRPFGRT